MQLELKVFGLPSLLVNQTPLRFPSRKGLALLIVLVFEGEQHREKLADLLWTDLPNPKDALRNVLAQVNKVLAASGAPTLSATRQTIAWNAQPLVDARQLEQGVVVSLGRFEKPWLEGFILEGASQFEAWAEERGAYYIGLLQQKLELHIEKMLETGRLEEALVAAQQRLRLDVLNEAAYRQLMRTQRRAGREAEARQTLLLCQTTLERELGLTPSALTLAVLNEPLPRWSETHLIGRETEQNWLEQVHHNKLFACLYGEAGSGKTALLRACLPEAQWLECRPNDTNMPFSSVLRAVRKRLREDVVLPDWAKPELGRFLPEFFAATNEQSLDNTRFYAALNLLFAPNRALVVDDLHLMDEMSLLWFWQFAERRIEDGLAATVLVYRPRSLEAKLHNNLLHLERQGAVSKPMLPFSLEAIALWLGRVGLPPNLAAEFLQLTGGNALYLQEAIAAYQSTGKFEAGLLPLLKQRLQTLAPLEWQLTQFVAVANNQATLGLASAVLQHDQLSLAQAWASLEEHDILRGAGFVHGLLCDAALALTPGTVQKALNGSILSSLEQRIQHGETIAKAVLAEFAAQAADPWREAQYRLQAGLEVYKLGLMRAGVQHLERCLDLLYQQPNLLGLPDLLRLYQDLLPIYRADVYSSGNIPRSLEQLLHIARQHHNLDLEAIALAAQADYCANVEQQPERAEQLFQQAQALHPSQEVLALILELRAWFENSRGATRLALHFAEQSHLYNPLRFGGLEAMYMFEQNLGLWQDAYTHALQALVVASSSNLSHARPYCLTMASFCALQLGNLQSAVQHNSLALELLENTQWHNALGFAARTQALILLEQDDLSAALEYAQHSIEYNQILGNLFAICSGYSVVARVHLAAYRPKDALHALEQAEQTLAKLAHLSIAGIMQSFLDSLRCQAGMQLGQNILPLAKRAIAARQNPPETASWLLLAPREYELAALVNAGLHQLAQTEFKTFKTLHPDNPRVNILHLRAQIALEPNNNTLRQQAKNLALELGFVMQARLMTDGWLSPPAPPN